MPGFAQRGLRAMGHGCVQRLLLLPLASEFFVLPEEPLFGGLRHIDYFVGAGLFRFVSHSVTQGRTKPDSILSRAILPAPRLRASVRDQPGPWSADSYK